MPDTPSQLLETWIFRQIPAGPADWFRGQLDKLQQAPSRQVFDITFGMIPRRLGKDDLALTKDDLAAATAARPGWIPAQWSVDVAARILLLIRHSDKINTSFAEQFKALHQTADLGELLALYHGLPLFAEPESLIDAAALGLRTNIRSEFQAIAHNNPFPAQYFSENTWNNMVLKALFIGVLLAPIEGLDARANPELARILHDYAHERWAAGRAVSPELWRCIGPFAEGDYIDDFKRVIDTGTATEKKAAALALASAPATPDVNALRARLSEHDAAIASGQLTWVAIAEEMLDEGTAITRKLNTEVEMHR